MTGSVGPAGFVPDPGQVPITTHEPMTRSWLDRVNTCPYRECRTGCARTLCHAGRGDNWGQTTWSDCRECLRRCDSSPPAPRSRSSWCPSPLEPGPGSGP